MDQQTNEQEPSSTEGGKVKVGDKVWVLCKVIDTGNDSVRVMGGMGTTWWTYAEQCRPVEPVVKDSLTTESNCPEISDSSSEQMREAFEAELIQEMGWDQSYFGRSENGYFDSQVEILWEDFQAGAKYGNPSGEWKPTIDEIEYAMDRSGVSSDPFQVGDAVRIKDDEDESLPLVIRSLQPSGPINTTLALCVSECGKRIRWSALEEMEPISKSDPIKVGDAVRFVLAGHKHHNTEGTIVLIEDSSERRYSFESNCGHIKGLCTIAELERIDKPDPINPSHYKQGGIECIEAMKVALGGGFLGYLRGNAIKYLWRYDKKNGAEDLKKARWYLDRLISEVGE